MPGVAVQLERNIDVTTEPKNQFIDTVVRTRKVDLNSYITTDSEDIKFKICTY